MRKHLFTLLFLYILSTPLIHAQGLDTLGAGSWADSLMRNMSKEEKLGQLFIVAAYSNRDSVHQNEISKLIRDYYIGGLCFFQGGPMRQAQQTNAYQAKSKIPLLISIDGEWGLSMRLDSVVRYPKQMTLGAIADDTLIYQFGVETARQLKRIGIHMNFAPCVDVNNNPRNPVINDRSFGEDKYKVAAKAIAYMRGMQDNGVLANAKHFPGHGNTDQDSHLTLPSVNRSRAQLDSLELYPFNELMRRGLASIMVAHLAVPSLDTTKNLAASISKVVVTGLLKQELKFSGLVVTDALNMKGVSSFYSPGVVDAKALLAGNDMLLFTENVPQAIVEIKRAIDSGLISMAEIEMRVRKILVAKYAVGLNNYKPVSMYGIFEDLNNNHAKLQSMQLYENAMTVLGNRNDMIPLKHLELRNIAAVSIGADYNNAFLSTCNYYAKMQMYALKKDASLNDFDFLNQSLEQFNTVIVGIHDMSRNESKNFSISKQTIDFLNNLAKRANVVVVIFGNAYSLRNFENLAPIVLAYEDNDFTRSLAAQAIFGGISAKGTLPITASENFRLGDGFRIEEAIRFKYTLPEEVGICSKCITQVDEVMEKAIAAGATPGAQILVARNGKVFYQKSFGNHSYNSSQPVSNNDLYDIASLTKILATNLMVMKMVEDDKLELHKKASSYLPYLKYSNKKSIRVHELLTHTAGLRPYIPYWKEAINVPQGAQSNFSVDSSSLYPLQVARNMYGRKEVVNQIKMANLNSELTTSGLYKYSDLGFYYLQEIVESAYDTSINYLLDENFYNKLGLSTMTFNPLNRFYENQITPTENDTLFRKQTLRGHVHDQGAALMGGVAGHAGLFSNASDVAIVMQMLLNGGTYGGDDFLNPKTIDKFSKKQSEDNRRGLGFDKPDPNPTISSAAKSASKASFGHTGFTGVCTWSDPETGLVYVFLSNRINPSTENKKLLEMNVRTDIHEIFYKAMEPNLNSGVPLK